MQLTQQKYRYLLPLFFISAAPCLSALQTVAIYQIEGANVNAQTAQTVNNLMVTFIKAQKKYHIIDMRPAYAPKEYSKNNTADFLFFAAVQAVPDGIQISLTLKRPQAKSTRFISKVYEHTSSLLLDSRLLISTLFDFSLALDRPVQQENLSEDDRLRPIEAIDSLVGSWQGEAGIDRIMILKGGHGIIILSNGTSFSLALTIEAGYLIVKPQGDMPSQRFLTIPDHIVNQIIQKIEPPEWRFLVSANNNLLSGIKQEVQVHHDDTTITDISYETVPVEWHRK
ncbi:MAG: TP0183 family DNA metabolism protein [Treponema sp.]